MSLFTFNLQVLDFNACVPQDEAEQLETAMEERHRKELQDWEQANPDPDAEKDTTTLTLASGLYDLKIGADEEKDVKVDTLFHLSLWIL